MELKIKTTDKLDNNVQNNASTNWCIVRVKGRNASDFRVFGHRLIGVVCARVYLFWMCVRIHISFSLCVCARACVCLCKCSIENHWFESKHLKANERKLKERTECSCDWLPAMIQIEREREIESAHITHTINLMCVITNNLWKWDDEWVGLAGIIIKSKTNRACQSIYIFCVLSIFNGLTTWRGTRVAFCCFYYEQFNYTSSIYQMIITSASVCQHSLDIRIF